MPPESVRTTLVSDVNFMLYTPLLPGAAGGTLEPRHVVVPLREALRRTDLRVGSVTGADPDRNVVSVESIEGPRRGDRLRPPHRRGRVDLANAAGARPRRARDRLQVAARRHRAAQPPPAHARGGRDARGPRRARGAAHVRLRRRGLRGARGPRGAPGLRRRRDRPLPALPHAGHAVDPRRGDRPGDARGLADARGVREPRAARPRHRDPHRDDARGADADDRAPQRRRGRPDADLRVDGRGPAASGRRAPRAAARRHRPDRGRQDDARPRPGERVGDRRRRGGAGPGEEARAAVPADRPARAAPGAARGAQRRRVARHGPRPAVRVPDARGVRRHGPGPGGGRDRGPALARAHRLGARPQLPPRHDARHRAQVPPPRRVERRARLRPRRVRARAAGAPRVARGPRARRRRGRRRTDAARRPRLVDRGGGRAGAAARAEGRRRRRRRRHRRRVHRDVVRVASPGGRPRPPDRPARGRPLRLRARAGATAASSRP